MPSTPRHAEDFDRALKTAEILKPSKAAAVELTGLTDSLASPAP
jgi:hypothetical protein